MEYASGIIVLDIQMESALNVSAITDYLHKAVSYHKISNAEHVQVDSPLSTIDVQESSQVAIDTIQTVNANNAEMASN